MTAGFPAAKTYPLQIGGNQFLAAASLRTGAGPYDFARKTLPSKLRSRHGEEPDMTIKVV